MQQAEQKPQNILTEEQIAKYKENLKKLRQQPQTQSFFLTFLDKPKEMFVFQNTKMEHVFRTLLRQTDGKQKLFVIDNGRYIASDDIKEFLVSQIGSQQIVLTSEEYEIKKILQKLRQPQLVDINKFNIPQSLFRESLVRFIQQNKTTNEFLSQLQKYVEKKIEKNEDLFENKYDLIKNLLPHEAQLCDTIKNFTIKSSNKNQSTVNKSNCDQSTADQISNISILNPIEKGKQKKPELHKVKCKQMFNKLRVQIQNYESTKDFEAEINNCLKIQSFNQIELQLKDVEKNKQDWKRFLLFIKTQKHHFLIYSTRGIVEKNSKNYNLDKEKKSSIFRKKEIGSGFIMVYSTDGSFKVFNGQNNIELIALGWNEIELSGLLKISFDKGMHLSMINSDIKQNELINYLKAEGEQIKILEYCSVSNNRNGQGLGFNKMSRFLNGLCRFEETKLKDIQNYEKQVQILKQVEEKMRGTKNFIQFLVEQLKNKKNLAQVDEKMLNQLLPQQKKIFFLIRQLIKKLSLNKGELDKSSIVDPNANNKVEPTKSGQDILKGIIENDKVDQKSEYQKGKSEET